MPPRFSASLPPRPLVRAPAAGAATALLPGRPARSGEVREFRLAAAPARIPLVGPGYPETAVWAFDGTVPGPELRVRQGDRVRIVVENQLGEGTTVHWHGLRVPNAMDGVPNLTQDPITPGGSFTYEFEVPDAGTYWYHPHQRSFEQVERGLAGAFVVEERRPIEVDRDITWVLDDWRLQDDAAISEDFGDLRDAAHAGRIGNTVSINGRVSDSFEVRTGERIRLRLINAANARIFGLDFAGHQPRIVALDGQPVAPHAPADGLVVLGPAMRADLVIDLTGRPGDRMTVVDRFYRGREYRLVDLVYGAPPLRDRPRDAPVELPANTMPEPDAAAATRTEIVLGGGMMGRMTSATVDGKPMDMRAMMHDGLVWAIYGVAARGHVMEPLLMLERGGSHILALHNDTAWHHPMHLHGHSFRVISRDGVATPRRDWQDTVLLAPDERAEIAFVADNPGDWMFHCHILEHQAAGMMAVIRVV